MAANVMIDMTAGAVPLLGDVVDFVWKSNRRNLDILERHAVQPSRTARKDRVWVLTVFGVLGLTCAGILAGLAFLVSATLKILAGS